MPPPTSYLIEGTIRTNSLILGSAEIEHIIDTNENGVQGLNLFIGGGTTTTKTTVYIKNLTTSEEITISTGSDGVYVYDLANLSEGYSNEDVILIRVSTYLTNDTEQTGEDFVRKNQEWNEQAQCPKRLLVDSFGNEINNQNPFPVQVIAENLDFMNCRRVYTRDPSNRNRIMQVDFYYKGKQYRKTITYTDTTTDHSIIEEV